MKGIAAVEYIQDDPTSLQHSTNNKTLDNFAELSRNRSSVALPVPISFVAAITYREHPSPSPAIRCAALLASSSSSFSFGPSRSRM